MARGAASGGPGSTRRRRGSDDPSRRSPESSGTGWGSKAFRKESELGGHGLCNPPQQGASSLVDGEAMLVDTATHISPASHDDMLGPHDGASAGRPNLGVGSLQRALDHERQAAAVRRASNSAAAVTTDGMPLVWTLRRMWRPDQSRVYGPNLTDYALRHGCRQSGVNAVGARLGMVEQEASMHQVGDTLPGVSLQGVVAALRLLTGTVPRMPDWRPERGLEWACRRWREPRRLRHGYLLNDPALTVLVSLAFARAEIGLQGV